LVSAVFIGQKNNNSFDLSFVEMKIISLIPSITELLFDLGLEDEVVGITKFCVHPQTWFRNKTRIGGPKSIDIEKINLLQPDLIIANKEENVKEQIEQLQSRNVIVTDVNNYEEALEMIQSVGRLVRKEVEALHLIKSIQQKFSSLQIKEQKTAAYLIWKAPYMTIGHDTFIHSMMERAGFKNVFSQWNRYPTITIDELKNLQPEYILLSSEPYPFKQKHIEELSPMLPHQKMMLVDGEMFSWYGSRMLLAAEYFGQLSSNYID
jgi:ABC-type Fe3+-hydroxamate transport system substrate-binding protein